VFPTIGIENQTQDSLYQQDYKLAQEKDLPQSTGYLYRKEDFEHWDPKHFARDFQNKHLNVDNAVTT